MAEHFIFPGGMDTEEISQILISVVVLSLAFAVPYAGGFSLTSAYAATFLAVLFTVGAGFILHELAHKFVAQRYGAQAAYRAWPMGLVLAAGLALIGSPIIFAAPGAVYIFGRNIDRKQNGLISLAGPATNAVLAVLFTAVAFVIPSPSIARIAFMGASVNAMLGLFNMIPIFPLDGSKILAWDWRAWLGLAAFLFIFPTIFLGGI